MQREQMSAGRKHRLFKNLIAILALTVLGGWGVARVAGRGPSYPKGDPAFQHFLAGEAAYEHKDYEKAHWWFEEALRLDPKRIECRRYIGEILVRQKNPFEGLKHLLEYLKGNKEENYLEDRR